MNLGEYLFVLLLVATCLMLFIAYLSFRKRKLAVAQYSALMMLAASFYSFGYAFEIISEDMEDIRFWLNIEYIGIPFITTFWLIFIIHFTGYQTLMKRWVWMLLFVIPILTFVLQLTNDIHDLFYENIRMDYSSSIPTVKTLKGPWYWVHIVYIYIQIIVGMSLFVLMYLKAVPHARKQIMIMILGAIAPWISNVVYLFGTFGLHVDFTPLGFTLSGVLYVWGIYQFNLLRLAPIALQKVYETMQDGVVFLDYDNNIINYNQAAKEVFEELHHIKGNKNSASIVFSNHPELLSKIIILENSDSQITIRNKGKTSYYHLKVSVIYDKGRMALGIMLLFSDITQTIDYQERLLFNINQLAELNAFKDKLFTVVAHDIRDPLAVLINLTEILEEEMETVGSGNIEIFQEVSGQVRYTYTLVENLLDWFRSTSGEVMSNPLTWNLAPIVQQFILSMRIRSEIKEIRISFNIDDEIQVFADKEILHLILRNLLSNAIKFTNIGGTIHIGATRDGDQVVISVRDTGVGITPDITKTLFSRANESPTSGTQGEKGTGLGLFLCKEFVHLNGGAIWVESVLGEGSTFFFSLPVNEAGRNMKILMERETEL
ncbi:sensor histidine kinase [Paenibacillus sp. CMAA1364]